MTGAVRWELRAPRRELGGRAVIPQLSHVSSCAVYVCLLSFRVSEFQLFSCVWCSKYNLHEGGGINWKSQEWWNEFCCTEIQDKSFSRLCLPLLSIYSWPDQSSKCSGVLGMGHALSWDCHLLGDCRMLFERFCTRWGRSQRFLALLHLRWKKLWHAAVRFNCWRRQDV